MSQAPLLSDAAARRAFEAAVLPLRGSLRAYGRRYCQSDSELDDLLQDTVLRAWCYWGSYEPGSNCRAWLQRILTTTYINGYRRKRRERQILGQFQVARRVAGEGGFADPADRGLDDVLSSEMAALSSEFREVVWAVAVDGQSYREVAEQLGCPVGTVMSRLHRARQRLASRLEPRADPQSAAA